MTTALQPPLAKRIETVITRHGHSRVDEYAWLRDPEWRAVMKDPSALDPEIGAYLEAENAYAEAALADVAGLREVLYAEMKGRIKEDDSTVPAPDGPYEYYRRFLPGGQHPLFCRRPRGREDGEQVLYHGDREAAGRAFFRIGAFRHGPIHRYAAYAVDLSGAEYFTLRFRETATGRDLPEAVENVQPDIAWAADGRAVLYIHLDENHRPTEVRLHRLGTKAADDVTVYREPDPGFYLSLGRSESGRFVVIHSHDHTTGEARLIDAARPAAPPLLVAARERGVEYSVTHHGDRLLILTNADGAEDFKIAEAPLGDPGRANWRDLVPHAPGRLIRSLRAFERYIVRLERVNALPRIVVTDLATGAEHEIEFAEEAYDLGIVPGFEFATTTLRFSYSSMTTPERIYDYNMDSRERTLRKEQEIPSGHDPASYVTRRIFALAGDGARLPISLVHRRDTPLDETAPLLLYGYGSYGIAIPAAFSPNRFSLLDRGFVYAIAHVRGGTDMGYGWYTAGKLSAKPNTFTDFIAAAEHLIAERYTRAGAIVAHGRSAGGLLAGAVANMRPDLFAGIVADVPFVDVLNTMLDGTLPLTPPEWPEWGNPIEDAEAYRTILTYSPYDNVRPQAYPHILATGGLTDPRVTYWEPAKWVARLRARKTDANLVLLRTNMAAGHGGAAGRFDQLEEVALTYAFALKAVGRADSAADS